MNATRPLPDDWCLHHFDHLSGDLRGATLPETMARMRALCPVARSGQYGGFWGVSGYEDALGVAQVGTQEGRAGRGRAVAAP